MSQAPALACGLLCATALLAAQSNGVPEAAHYRCEYLAPPAGTFAEVGGLGFTASGRLVVSTRFGQVWILDDPLAADPAQVRWRLYAEGLHEGLGLHVAGEEIHVLQRGEISRLIDTDGDGRADLVRTVAGPIALSGNYHEFAFGLPRTRTGSFFLALNLGFLPETWWLGSSLAPWRGWVLEATPDGALLPYATGLRSPDGVSLSPQDELFVTDNQGDWVPACAVFAVRKGGFHGHPAGLLWQREWQAAGRVPSQTVPPAGVQREPAALWLPYDLSRSVGDLAWDTSAGRFGPFAGQVFAAELTLGRVLRLQLERVRDQWQGAAFAFRDDVGSAHRVCFAPDGTLFAGLTNRGWGGAGKAHGIARLRFTGMAPFAMQRVELRPGGFAFTFTEPLAADPRPEQLEVTQYEYAWWWKYGSPELGARPLRVRTLETSLDQRRVTAHLDDLRPGYVTRMVWKDLRSRTGAALRPPRVDYTLNQLHDGPPNAKPVAVEVPPPQTRQEAAEGWVALQDGRNLDAFTRRDGWREAGEPVTLPRAATQQLESAPGTQVALGAPDAAGKPALLVARFPHADVAVHAAVFLPRDGRVEFLFQGRNGVELREGADLPKGEWVEVDLEFRTAPPRLTSLRVGGKRFLQQEGRVVARDRALARSGAAILDGEGADGPLAVVAHTPVALRDLQIRSLAPRDERGWKPLFDGKTLAGWKVTGAGRWQVREGRIVGEGPPGYLHTERGDWKDFEWRARVRINHGGNSGMYFRKTFGDDAFKGYEAQINRSMAADPVKTGSLYRRELLKTQLVTGDDVWFTQRVACRDEAQGVRIRIWLNEILVVDHVDRERAFPFGHLAFQQHHDGSRVEIASVEHR